MTKTVVEAARFANTEDGYAQLTAFAARWSRRRWAVEGCHGAGRSLAQRLVADSEVVLDVPAKLAARVRVYSRGHGRKTDKDDAVSVGLAAIEVIARYVEALGGRLDLVASFGDRTVRLPVSDAATAA